MGLIEIDVTSMDAESCCDFLRVYDGADITAPLIATVTGTSATQDIVTTGGEAFVSWTSDGSSVGNSFSAEYASSTPCGLNEGTYTACTGTITDLSDDNDYTNNADCSWLISPSGSSGIQLSLSYFDLAQGDYLRIHDGGTALDPILLEVTENLVPPTVYSTGSYAYVSFQSDADSTAGGFSLEYSCIPVGIDAQSDIPFLIYPNPTSDVVNIDFGSYQRDGMIVSVYNMEGQLLLRNNASELRSEGGKHQLNLTSFPQGFYTINFISEEQFVFNYNIVKVD